MQKHIRYLAVSGFECWYVAAVIFGRDFIIHKIDRDEEIIQNLIIIEERFWKEHVMAHVMPDPDGSKSCSEQIAKLYFKANEADVAVLSDEEMKLFEQEATATLKNGKMKYTAGFYCLLLLHTGMRVGEMIALRWRDWKGAHLIIEKSISMAKNRSKISDEDNNYISLEGSTKNQKARTIELTKEAQYILQKIKENRDSSEPDQFIVTTKTGKINTASNLEHRMKVILKNAELQDVSGGLHIFRKTFATRMYESGARVEEIAAYIGDLESTTQKYYIAIRKKVISNGEVRQVVKLPRVKEESTVA